MVRINAFGDDRKIPKLSINVKVKVKIDSPSDIVKWNNVFGYIMKKPRTKLDFINVNPIRNLKLNNITVEKIKNYISEEDYTQLLKVENIFNTNLTNDLKAFILAILKIPYQTLEEISNKDTLNFN